MKKNALIKGLSNLDPNDIEFLGEKIKQKMLDEAIDEEPVPISGNVNVFMAVLRPMGYFTTVHLILTEAANE